MKILVLTNMYPPQHYGGYELSCEDAVGRWRAAGHDVTVLTSDIVVRREVPPDPPWVRRALSIYWDDHRVLHPSKIERLRQERRNQQAMRAVLDEHRPDVVSAWHMGAMSLALLTTVEDRRIPVVLVVGDNWLCYAHDMDAWTRMFAERPGIGRVVERVTGLVTRRPDLADCAACFVSACVLRNAEAIGAFRPEERLVVPPGIDPERFSPRPDAEHPWRGRLLYVGRIDERKGVATAVRALAALPDARLDVLGDGEAAYRDHVAALVDTLGVSDRVAFGVVDQPELVARYAAADVVVFPSEWEEPFGLVPLEAMSVGTPVVATGSGGSGEFLEDGVNCLLFPPGDADALAARVQRLAADPGLRASLVAGGRRTVGRYTAARYADELLAVHRRRGTT